MIRRALACAVLLLVLSSCSLPSLSPAVPTETPCIDSVGLECGPIDSSLTSGTGEPGSSICVIVTRTAPPDHEATPDFRPESSNIIVDPHVEICTSASEIQVGELVTVSGQPVDIGLPIFYVSLVDAASGEEMSFRVQNDTVEQKEGQSDVLELVEVEADNWSVDLTFRGIGVGKTRIRINATGEIHSGEGATWGGGGSESLEIEVVTSLSD